MFDFANIPLAALLVLITLVTVSLVQVFYWIHYSKILRKVSHTDAQVPVSVIVVVNESHIEWINGDMKNLFNQDHFKYEVVVVNDCGGEEITILLRQLCVKYPIMRCTEIIPDRKFCHTVKIAKLMGIKCAKYEHLLFVEPWTRPSSTRWLTEMASGFAPAKDLVVGMSLPEKNGMWWNGLARSFSMVSLIRASRAAMTGRPYRASRSNFGFTKSIFFSTGGYNYLSTGYGDNDLYIKEISKPGNSSFVLTKECVMLSSLPDSFNQWFQDLRFSTATFRHYRLGVKIGIFIYLLSLLLFWLSLALSIFFFRDDIVMLSLPVACFIIRQALVYGIYCAISTKLGFKGMLGGFILYDFFMPLWEMLLSISRNFGAPSRY